MRLVRIFAGALALTIAAGGAAWFWYDRIREPVIAEGPLSDALLAALDPEERNQILDDLAADFVPVDAPLTERLPVLVENGFACSIIGAMVEGSQYISCTRPIIGTGFCEGFRYYAYETALGEIIETTMTAYDATRSRNVSGQCDNNRRRYIDDLEGGRAG